MCSDYKNATGEQVCIQQKQYLKSEWRAGGLR